MKKAVQDNLNLFKKYNIPFTLKDEETMLIKTKAIAYEVDLNTFSNNPFVFKVTNKTSNSTKLTSKDTFIQLMCKNFSLPFEHWIEKHRVAQQGMVKEMPEDFIIGQLYTTTWANPVAVWVLKEIIGDTDAILSSPKTGTNITSKISELRVWVKQS